MNPRRRSQLGKKIEREMARLGIVQAELAETIGVSQQTISKWLTGETLPRPRVVPRLEEALGLEANSLGPLVFGGTAPIEEPKAVDVRERRSAMSALSRRLNALDNEDLFRVRAYVDGLLDSKR